MTKTGVLWRSLTALAALSPVVLSLALAGCDDPAEPDTSGLRISVTTTGVAFDGDDYVVLMDGVEIERRIGLNETILLDGERGQTVEVELADVADNCHVDGPRRRTVTLTASPVTRVSYDVHCVAPAGLEGARLVFETGACGGYPVFPVQHCDLYALPLDGGEGHRLTDEKGNFQPAISVDGSAIAFTRLSPDGDPASGWGTDVYAMDGDGGNLRRITEDGRSSDPSWAPDGTRIVYVVGLPAGGPGALRIRRLDDDDALSLSLPAPAVAGAPAWSPDGTRIAFTRWETGVGSIHTISPDGGEAVLVAAGGDAPVWSPGSDRLAYSVGGSIYVIGRNEEAGTLLLSGSHWTKWTPTDWSPNGEWIALTRQENARRDVYLLRVDGGAMVRMTLDERSGAAVFAPGSPGEETPGTTATLRISAATTGAAFDADDYAVLVDGVEIGQRLGLDDTLSVSVEAGRTVELELADVADNCQVVAPHRALTPAAGSVTPVSYAVHCVAPAGLEDARLVLAAGRCGIDAMIVFGMGADLYALTLDGSEGRPLTTGGRSCHPAISADGSAIAFTRRSDDGHPLTGWDPDVYTMDVDGSNVRRITEDGQSWDPSWSPDGTRIVYVLGFAYPTWEGQLMVQRLDDEDAPPDSLETPADALMPVWSPDGSRIAFSSGHDIYTMAPDGSGAVLVAPGGYGPVWSPASDRLAYGIGGSVYVRGLNDEAGTQLLLRDTGSGWVPTDWSPDGEWIALTRQEDASLDVYLLRAEDGTLVRVTRDRRSSSAVFVPGA